jgi:hypothetical protein
MSHSNNTNNLHIISENSLLSLQNIKLVVARLSVLCYPSIVIAVCHKIVHINFYELFFPFFDLFGTTIFISNFIDFFACRKLTLFFISHEVLWARYLIELLRIGIIKKLK